MVDTTIYIQQLTFKLRDANKRNIELSAENAQLKLQNGLLEQEISNLKTSERETKYVVVSHKTKAGRYYTRECEKCGYDIGLYDNENKYCPNCGRKVIPYKHDRSHPCADSIMMGD